MNDPQGSGGDFPLGSRQPSHPPLNEAPPFDQRGPSQSEPPGLLVLHLVLYDVQDVFGTDSDAIVVERGAVLHAVPAVTEMIGATGVGVDSRRFATLIYLRDVPGLAAYSADPVHHRYAFDWFLPATKNVQVGDFIVDSIPPESFGAVEAFMTQGHQAVEPGIRLRIERALERVRQVPGVVGVQAGPAVNSQVTGALGGVVFFSSVIAAERARSDADYASWLALVGQLSLSRFFGHAARIAAPTD